MVAFLPTPPPFSVITGLDPATHVWTLPSGTGLNHVDTRVKPAHDDGRQV